MKSEFSLDFICSILGWMRHIVSVNEALERTPGVQMPLHHPHSHIEFQRRCRLIMAICLWSIFGRCGGFRNDRSALRTY